jgi:hypothetical protein
VISLSSDHGGVLKKEKDVQLYDDGTEAQV